MKAGQPNEISSLDTPSALGLHRDEQIQRFRVVRTLFIVALVLSGIAALPLRCELKTFASLMGVSAN